LAVTIERVKALREATGAGILDCKKALEAAGGDFDRAAEYLREKGLAAAAKKVGRVANQGVIEAYVHAGARHGALVELNCETDFVARTPEFQQLAHDLAMQVVATQPRYLMPEEIPPEVLEAKRNIYRSEAGGAEAGKPPHILEQIVDGRMEKFYQEACLLKQPFIKDDGITVEELIKQTIARVGENIIVRRFVRYEVGEPE
jgi:elongation factor Ts